MTRRPDLFLIGAPKSGTTSLYSYLREHPDIFMSREKEPEYFAPDVVRMHRRSPFIYPTDEARYLALFAGARDEAHVGEASTTYLASHEAAALVHDFQPDARIIVMVRNPVDLLYSMYWHRLAHGAEWVEDFGAALALDDDRRHGRQLQKGQAGIGAAYRDYGMLGEQLDRWLALFPRDHVHVIVFDDFVADTLDAYKSVLHFLEVDEAAMPVSFSVRNARHAPRKGPARLVFNNSLARWVTRTAIPSVVGEQATNRLANRFSRDQVTRRARATEPIPDTLRDQLQDEFSADVDHLGDLIGRDLRTEWFH